VCVAAASVHLLALEGVTGALRQAAAATPYDQLRVEAEGLANWLDHAVVSYTPPPASTLTGQDTEVCLCWNVLTCRR
jgi:hypothetical protein